MAVLQLFRLALTAEHAVSQLLNMPQPPGFASWRNCADMWSCQCDTLADVVTHVHTSLHLSLIKSTSTADGVALQIKIM